MSFINGFTKISNVLSGLETAGKESIKDALKLKGLREAVGNIKSTYKGKMKDLIKTPQGRNDLGHAVAKSLPSVAAGSLYGYAAKKSYDAMKEKNQTSYDNYYTQ